MSSNILYRILDTEREQHIVLPLLAECFPDYWEQVAARDRRMPFEEISFAAFAGDALIGHCGVIPYHASDGNGGFFMAGGIASVAVKPEARGRGVARTLCLETRKWADEKGYDTLTLYTGKDRVYESAGWENYESTRPRTIVFGNVSGRADAVHGSVFSPEERRSIAAIYENGEDFRGKVKRGNGREFHGWSRIFGDPAHEFAWNDGIYALFFDGCLAECFFEDGVSSEKVTDFLSRYAVNGRLDAALHEESRIWNMLEKCGCFFVPCENDLMHGEHPMILDLSDRRTHSSELVHYPLGDKF